MSGGSFNYLCFKYAYELIEREVEIKDMADALADGGNK